MNENERVCDERLQRVCTENEARVCPKVRVADVIRVVKGSTPTDLLGYALAAHFDFVIYDSSNQPLFAVEFDGESHRHETQIERDRKKWLLCEMSKFPLLRINANYLSRSYKGKDLLSHIIDVYFLERSFNDAQEKGLVPEEEGFTAWSMMVRREDGSWEHPYWLSLDAINDCRRLHREHIVLDPVPSYLSAWDAMGNLHAVGWILIDKDSGVFTNNGVRKQLFQHDFTDTLRDIVTIESHLKLIRALSGSDLRLSRDQLLNEIIDFQKKHKVTSSTVCSSLAPIRFEI